MWFGRRESRQTTPDIARRILANKDIKNWYRTVLRAWDLHLLKGGQLPFLMPAHSFDAYTKTLYREILNRTPELLNANSAPFRTGGEISRCFFAYEMIAQYDCVPVFNERRKILHKILNTSRNTKKVTVVQQNVSDLVSQVRKYNPKTFCIQNLEGDKVVQGITYLQQRFPEPASWEE